MDVYLQYTALFKKDAIPAAPSDPNQEAVLSTSNSLSSCNILPETIISVSRTTHFDPQLLHKQLRDGDHTGPERAKEDSKLTKLERLDLSLKLPIKKLESEDEDVCPTCLEGNTF